MPYAARTPPPASPSPTQKALLRDSLPELEKLYRDRAAWERLSPTEQQAVINLLRSIPTPPSRAAREAHRGYGMVDFIVGSLGWAPTQEALAAGYTLPITPDQVRIVESVEKNRRTAVTSGHGVGKTRISAGVVLAYLYAKANRKVITTAATWTQVEKQLWSEIRSAGAKAPVKLPGRFLTTAIDVAPDWFALGLSTDDYSKFSGVHAPGGVLVVIDEATGVREEIAQAADSLILGPDDRLLAIGNPTDPMSWFKGASESPVWNRIVVDCRNHPNVLHDNPYIIPGAVTRQWVQEQVETLGETDPLFLAKVAGQWPDLKADALIQLGWVVGAQIREEFPEDFKGAVIAADIAGPGGDLLTISLIKNGRWRLVKWRQRHDYMAGVGDIIEQVVRYSARVVVIDDTGVGGVVTSRLREVQRGVDSLLPEELRVIPVNFAAAAPQKRNFNRFKDEAWWAARDAMKKGLVNLPDDEEIRGYRLPREHNFIKQITVAIYRLDSAGRVDVYDRKDDHDEETKLLPSVSPDLAHTFILACYGAKLLREDRRPAPPKDNVDAATQEFHEAMRAKVEEYHKALERAAEAGEKRGGEMGGGYAGGEEIW